jgi:hypothetical protein
MKAALEVRVESADQMLAVNMSIVGPLKIRSLVRASYLLSQAVE